MDIKYNEATPNRPEGDRLVDAPCIFFDIDDTVFQLKNEDAWQKNDRNAITVFKTDKLTIVVVALHAGAGLLDNSVEGNLTIQVIDGKLTIAAPHGNIELYAKQVLTFHAGIRHSIKALDDSVLLMTNHT